MSKAKTIPAISKRLTTLLIILALSILITLVVLFVRWNNKKDVITANEIPADVREALERSIEAIKSAAFRAKIQKGINIPILLYHYVEYVKDQGDTIRKSLNIEPAIFDVQIKSLLDAGYTFITTSDIPKIFNREMDLPPNPVILTFDDGYRDFYTDVLPILKKYKVKAVAYIVPNFINGINSMFSNQIIEATKSGLVEIGAHTMNHVWLKGKNLKTVKYEVEESRKYLEDKYHISVVSFAYPYGVLDLQAAKVVEDAGFTNAVTTAAGEEASTNNLFFLYRVRPGKRTGDALINYIKNSTFPKENILDPIKRRN